MSNYWEKRAARQMHQQMQKAEDYLDELAEYYLAASLDLQDKAKDILRKFRLKHNLTQYKAEQILANIDPADIKGILERLAKDPKNKEIKDELTTQAQAARIRNLETLFDQVKKTTESLAERFKKGASKLLKKLGLDAWYKAVFNLQKQAGSGWKVKGPTNKLIEKAVKTPWTGSGFSERIWGNTEELEKAVKKEIMKSLLTGRPIEESARAINDQFGKGMFNARRLMRTEAAYITNQMALEGYKSQGVEKYVYVAILDLKTSKICQSLDKKRFLVKNAQVGVNFPPMHPFCRSTTVPWVSDALLKRMRQKAIDPKTGKRVTVPGDMTYQEWYKQFVEGQPTSDRTTRITDAHTYSTRIAPGSDTVTYASAPATVTSSNDLRSAPFRDTTKEWQEKTIDEPDYDTLNEFEGYTVDDQNVLQNHTESEKNLAKEVSMATGKPVRMVPEITGENKKHRTPDFVSGDDELNLNERWEIKETKCTAKDPLRNHMDKEKADYYLFDVTGREISDEKLFGFAEEALTAYNTGKYVKTVALYENGKFIKVLEK